MSPHDRPPGGGRHLRECPTRFPLRRVEHSGRRGRAGAAASVSNRANRATSVRSAGPLRRPGRLGRR
ncbi:hypothetical protein STTU_4316 [Streptomyces sp. Tu6071]|nr:hypothetical protein STTU_4316 [Streptomyces sp. Tu6071]